MTAIVILSITLVISLVINVIQYRRQVQLEASIDEIQFDENAYNKFFDEIYIGITHSYMNLERIDKNGAFKNDDEVGFTFKSIFKIMTDLKKFLDDANRDVETEEKE